MESWQSQVLTIIALNENLTFVELERPEGFQFTYGQYAEITPKTGKSKYLALACSPQDSTLKLLVAGDTTDWVISGEVTLGAAKGGFAAALATRRDLLLVTHGSGISAMFGLLKDREDGIQKYQLTCLWGIRSTSDLTIPPQYGVSEQFIHPVFSRGTGELTGHVQNHLKTFYRSGMAVLLVGSKEMTTDVKNHLLALGAAPEDIFLNF